MNKNTVGFLLIIAGIFVLFYGFNSSLYWGTMGHYDKLDSEVVSYSYLSEFNIWEFLIPAALGSFLICLGFCRIKSSIEAKKRNLIFAIIFFLVFFFGVVMSYGIASTKDDIIKEKQALIQKAIDESKADEDIETLVKEEVENILGEKVLGGEKLFDLSKSQVDILCQELKNNAITSTCPICSVTQHLIVSSFSKETNHNAEYIISENNGEYDVDIKLHIIYGRNTRPGFAEMSLAFSNEGELLGSSFSDLSCL